MSEQHSLYFIYWTGGGMPPVGATGRTIGAFTVDDLVERVGAWLRSQQPKDDDTPADTPLGLWPDPSDLVEDDDDAA